MHFNWFVWAVILFLQNISFTYVSRARSSGSIFRHFKASIFSNGIWIFSQIIMLGAMFDNLTGKHGLAAQLTSAAVYTVACVSGSIFAHYLAMKTEKGKNAVGFNKKYAQIPVEEWAQLQQDLIAVATLGKTTLAVLEKLPTREEVTQVTARIDTLVSNTDAAIKDANEKFQRVSDIAHQAYDITVGLIPDAGIKAQKFDGATVVTGLPQKG